MGLDMYLSAKTYVKNWEHTKPEAKTEVKVKRGGKLLKTIQPARVSYITEEIGYWRKANAIHSWFVNNCNEGDDDCDTYYVSQEKLEELSGIVERVLKASVLVEGMIQNGTTNGVPNMEKGKYVKDSTVAKELLPTGEGSFFGSTDYDEWYVQDLRTTKTILKEAIKCAKNGADIYYSASW
jgi:hypothetical protein